MKYDQRELNLLMSDIGCSLRRLMERDENVEDVIILEESISRILKHYVKDEFNTK